MTAFPCGVGKKENSHLLIIADIASSLLSMQHYHRNSYGHEATFKVLVLGDSGVGKSSLVHMLCHGEPLRSVVPTVGCNVDVRLHTSTIPTAASLSTRPGHSSLLNRTTPSPSTAPGASSTETFIEFYDISGSPAVRNPKSRNMFYSGAAYQGIILVHDLCNKRSSDNLWKWIGDYLEISAPTMSKDAGGYNGAQYGQFNTPLLVVGTKNDIPASYDQQGGGQKAPGFDLAEKYGGEAISVCAISSAEFMPNSSTSIAFNMFFSRVIDPGSNDLRQRGTFHGGNNNYLSTSPPPPSRSSPTPTSENDKYQHIEYRSEEATLGSSSIPIMDFATFTGGSTPDGMDGQRTPVRAGSPLSQLQTPIRSITPTGVSTSTSKSALRAQYERNRNVLCKPV
ncbi:Rab-like protein 3 [Entomortierella beljakovae]|nr:Rab-like protein 3 [Entomortierella beljakovae]